MPTHLFWLTICLMLAALLAPMQLYLVLPALDVLAERFSVSQLQAGSAGSVFGFGYAIGMVLVAPWSDRFGRFRFLGLGLVLLAMVSTALGLIDLAPASVPAPGPMPAPMPPPLPNPAIWPWFLAGRFCQGLTAAMIPTTALALVAETLQPKQRAFGVSLVTFALLQSATVGQFAGLLVGPLGLRVLMPAYALICLVLLAGLWLVRPSQIRPSQNQRATQDSAPSVPPALVASLPLRTFLPAWIAAATILFGFIAVIVAIGQAPTIRPTQVQMLRWIAVPALATCFLAAPISNRFGGLATARLGFVLSAGGSALAAIAMADALLWSPLLAFGYALVAGGIGLAVPGVVGGLSARATAANRGRVLALYGFSLFLGASAAPPFAQSAAQTFGLPITLAIPALASLLACLLLTPWAKLIPHRVTGVHT